MNTVISSEGDASPVLNVVVEGGVGGGAVIVIGDEAVSAGKGTSAATSLASVGILGIIAALNVVTAGVHGLAASITRAVEPALSASRLAGTIDALVGIDVQGGSRPAVVAATTAGLDGGDVGLATVSIVAITVVEASLADLGATRSLVSAANRSGVVEVEVLTGSVVRAAWAARGVGLTTISRLTAVTPALSAWGRLNLGLSPM